MRLFKKLRRKLDYLSAEEVESIQQAYLVAFDAHRGQKRRTGEDYITHPVAVAGLLADMKMDHQTIMAALLHDVIEDTPVSKQTLEEKFGKSVADLVDGVSKLTQIEFTSKAEAQAENFRKMVLAMARDIRVILVKLADRLHNMRTLGSLPFDKRQRIARETLEIFAPIAHRLGMRDLAVELEELGFKALYPRRYSILKDAIERARGHRKKMLDLITKALNDALINRNLPSCVVMGREKHLHSIYRKMKNRHIPFNEIMDVYAFRIIVDDVDTAYRVLGVVHNLFKPVPERFKDYIAIPKGNGYQSLHTTLFGPYGLPLEVQIRTTEMDRMATSGIAAHWLYKTENRGEIKPHLRAQKWVKNLLELQQHAGNSLEFIENVKVDLFPDEVYVFTPKGDIKELPSGATALDFAYGVHTDIGNHCVAVKVDRQIAPLSAVLASGQTVEVITSAAARPNPAWLDFVATGKARSSIRDFLKTQRRAESIEFGKDLLQKALSNYGLTIKKLSEPAIHYLLQETSQPTFDDLLEEIGLGNRAAAIVAHRFGDLLGDTKIKEEDVIKHQQIPLIIKGTEGVVVKFASCCNPIPGDPIVGLLVPGKGLVVHMARCKQIVKMRRHPEQGVPLRWAEKITSEFAAMIVVEVVNQRGVLAMIALAISDQDANIEDVSIDERDGQHFLVNFRVLVQGRAHLAKILRSLRKIPQVIRIVRSRASDSR